MGIKLRIETLEEVAEDIRDAYIADGDGFILDYSLISEHPGVKKVKQTADDVDKKRKDAEKKLKETTDKFGSVDLDAYTEALKKIEAMDDQKMIDAGKIDELVAKRSSDQIADLSAKIDALTTNVAEGASLLLAKDTELSNIKIYDAIKETALGKGVRKDALTDISNRARGVWTLDDEGKPIAKEGEDVMRGKTGEHLTIAEWVDTLSTTATYLFEPNEGGGAKGNESTNFAGAKVMSLDGAQNDLEKIASGDATIQR